MKGEILVLRFIPTKAQEDAQRLIGIVKASGLNDNFEIATALYRWTENRPWYSDIRSGLEKYLEENKNPVGSGFGS